MRSVVVYQLLSLDGVAESPDDFIRQFEDVTEEHLGRVIASQDAVLLGRRTYDAWSQFWPGSDIEPFASFINPVQKYLVTSAPPGELWTNTAVVDGDLAAFVENLKQQPGGDIGVHGSITVARALLDAGLVDQIRLVVAPAVHVHGRKLFDVGTATRLQLTSCAASPAGYLLLDYDVQR